jgi:hypothetical protein
MGACKNNIQDNRFADDSIKFNNYLNTFKSEINKTNLNFVLISEQGCGPCIKKTMGHIRNRDNYVYVVNPDTYEKYFKDSFIKKEHLIIDSAYMVDNIKYAYDNIGIVEMKDTKINNVYEIQPYTADSVLAMVVK